MNTYRQHAQNIRGTEALSRHFAIGLMFTISATVAISLASASAQAQVLAAETAGARLRVIAAHDSGVENRTTGPENVPVAVRPGALTFSFQLIGTRSAGKTVTFTNKGSVDVNFTSIGLEGVSADDFSFTTTCGTNGSALAPGASCLTTVYYSPSFAGGESVILLFRGNFAEQSVFTEGTGTAVIVKPKSLTFANTTVGTTSSPKTVTFENIGPTALPITSFTWTRSNSYFSQTNTCGTSVPAHSSCGISITFSPLTPGTFSDMLNIGDPDPTGPQKITATGTGVAAADVAP